MSSLVGFLGAEPYPHAVVASDRRATIRDEGSTTTIDGIQKLWTAGPWIVGMTTDSEDGMAFGDDQAALLSPIEEAQNLRDAVQAAQGWADERDRMDTAVFVGSIAPLQFVEIYELEVNPLDLGDGVLSGIAHWVPHFIQGTGDNRHEAMDMGEMSPYEKAELAIWIVGAEARRCEFTQSSDNRVGYTVDVAIMKGKEDGIHPEMFTVSAPTEPTMSVL